MVNMTKSVKSEQIAQWYLLKPIPTKLEQKQYQTHFETQISYYENVSYGSDKQVVKLKS